MNDHFLPIRSKPGLPMQVSKWLSSPLLIDENEMQGLLHALGEFEIFAISGVMLKGSGLISQEDFLDCYQKYIEALRESRLPEDARLQRYFSSVFSKTREALYVVPIDESRQLIKVDRPVVQLQMHRFSCGADKKFRSMAFGQNSIYWGIQFSYPQLYQSPDLQVITIRETDEFPNTALFKTLQRWVRENTVATPFLVEGKRVNVPMRLGKKCFSWINHHPQLKEAGLEVIVK